MAYQPEIQEEPEYIVITRYGMTVHRSYLSRGNEPHQHHGQHPGKSAQVGQRLIRIVIAVTSTKPPAGEATN